MKTITLVNEKGGVGKTTLALHLAAGLAARNKRVMVMDMDPQGHSTLRLGQQKGGEMYDLLVRNAPFKTMARGIRPEKFGIPGEVLPKGKLWVVPSNTETRNIANMMQDSWALYIKLQEIKSQVDYVIFDTSPTPSLLHGAIYLASDALIIPTECTYSAFDGVVETMNHLKSSSAARVRNGMQALRILGIVPTKYQKITNEHSENLEALQNQFSGMVWEPIANRILWTETESRHLPVWALDPNHDASIEAYGLIDQFEERMYARQSI